MYFSNETKDIRIPLFVPQRGDVQRTVPKFTSTERRYFRMTLTCMAVAQWISALIIVSWRHWFKPHCSQHVVVSLGKTPHPKALLCSVLNVCKSLWVKASNKCPVMVVKVLSFSSSQQGPAAEGLQLPERHQHLEPLRHRRGLLLHALRRHEQPDRSLEDPLRPGPGRPVR